MSVALMEDELADVNLDGVPLVSDNPSDWLVPKTMTDHDTVFGWWEHMHHHESLWSTERLVALQTLIDSRMTNGVVAPGRHGKVRSATERLIGSGMSWSELEMVTGLKPEQLLGGPGWKAWQMLEAGAEVDQVLAECAESEKSVRRYHKMLNGAPVVRVWPRAMKTEAATLLDSGLTYRQIAEVLSERHGCTIGFNTVHSWTRRARR